LLLFLTFSLSIAPGGKAGRFEASYQKAACLDFTTRWLAFGLAKAGLSRKEFLW
jgi:hypothetical protein